MRLRLGLAAALVALAAAALLGSARPPEGMCTRALAPQETTRLAQAETAINETADGLLVAAHKGDVARLEKDLNSIATAVAAQKAETTLAVKALDVKIQRLFDEIAAADLAEFRALRAQGGDPRVLGEMSKLAQRKKNSLTVVNIGTFATRNLPDYDPRFVPIKKLIYEKADVAKAFETAVAKAETTAAEMREQLRVSQLGLRQVEKRVARSGRYAKSGDLAGHLEAVGTHRRKIEQLQRDVAKLEKQFTDSLKSAKDDVRNAKNWADWYDREGKPLEAQAARADAEKIQARANARLDAQRVEIQNLTRAWQAERDAIDALEGARARAVAVSGNAAYDIETGAARMDELDRILFGKKIAEAAELEARAAQLTGPLGIARARDQPAVADLVARAAAARAAAAEIDSLYVNRPLVKDAATRLATAGAEREAALARGLERAKQGFLRAGERVAEKARRAAAETAAYEARLAKASQTEVVVRDGKYVYADPEGAAAAMLPADPTRLYNFPEIKEDIARYGPAETPQARLDRADRVAAAVSARSSVASAAQKQPKNKAGGVKTGGLAQSLKELKNYTSLFKF